MSDTLKSYVKAAAIGAVIGMLSALPIWVAKSDLFHFNCSEETSSLCSLIWVLIIPFGFVYLLSILIAPVLATPWHLLLSGLAPRHTAILIGASFNGALLSVAIKYLHTVRKARAKKS